jgi:hypothetical protein
MKRNFILILSKHFFKNFAIKLYKNKNKEKEDFFSGEKKYIKKKKFSKKQKIKSAKFIE